MHHDPRPTPGLRDLARSLRAEPSASGVLELLSTLLVELLDLDGAAVSLTSAGLHPGLVVGLGPEAVRLQQLQLSLGLGPCADAERTLTTVTVEDLGATGSSSPLSEHLDGQWSGSVTAFALLEDGQCLGTVGLYAQAGRRLAAGEEDAVGLLAEVALARLRDAELRTSQTNFVAAVSHELRSPLTSIGGYVELLLDPSSDPLGPDQDHFVRAILRSSERLAALTEDLISLTALEPGSPHPSHAPVDLGQVVVAAQLSLEPTVAARRLTVAFVVPPTAVPVRGDAPQLESVVTNLVVNALKFTPDGGRVSCRLETHGTHALLTVIDSGLGIPLAEQAHLFTPFFRSSTARLRGIPGSGLGLSIVRRIVEAHGGRITVSSEHLAGALFLVDLPLTSSLDEDEDEDEGR